MGNPYPDTEREMLRAHYVKLRAALCQSCGAQLQWWKTTFGKNMPFNLADDHGVYKLHECPKRKPVARPTPVEDLTKRLGFIRMTQKARTIVMIDKDGGIIATWAKGLPAEDLRTDLISAANFVRAEVLKEAN